MAERYGSLASGNGQAIRGRVQASRLSKKEVLDPAGWIGGSTNERHYRDRSLNRFHKMGVKQG